MVGTQSLESSHASRMPQTTEGGTYHKDSFTLASFEPVSFVIGVTISGALLEHFRKGGHEEAVTVRRQHLHGGFLLSALVNSIAGALIATVPYIGTNVFSAVAEVVGLDALSYPLSVWVVPGGALSGLITTLLLFSSRRG